MWILMYSSDKADTTKFTVIKIFFVKSVMKLCISLGGASAFISLVYYFASVTQALVLFEIQQVLHILAESMIFLLFKPWKTSRTEKQGEHE